MTLPSNAATRSSTPTCTRIKLSGGEVIYAVRRSLNEDGNGSVLTVMKNGTNSGFLTSSNAKIARRLNKLPEALRRERYGFVRIIAHQVSSAPNGYGVIEIVRPRVGKKLRLRFHPYLNPHAPYKGFDINEFTLPMRDWGRVVSIDDNERVFDRAS